MTEEEELAMALAMSAEASQPSPSAPAPAATQTSASASAPIATISKSVEPPASSMSMAAPAVPASSESMQGSQASKKVCSGMGAHLGLELCMLRGLEAARYVSFVTRAAPLLLCKCRPGHLMPVLQAKT